MCANADVRECTRFDARKAVAYGLLVAPALLLIGLGFLYPIVAFLLFGLFVEPAATITTLLSELAMFGDMAMRTLSLGFWTTGVTLVLGYPVAYYLVRSTSRFRYLVFLAIFVPLMFSIVVRTFGWIILLGSDGVLNSFLLSLGIIATPIVWLYDFKATVLGLVHIFLPFMVLSIMSALSRIDRHVEEAASILGATAWQVFRRVTLPLSAQGVFGGCALVFCLTMGAYVTPKLLGGGRVQVLATEIYVQMLEIGDWAAAGLLGLMLTVISLFVVMLYRLLMRNATAE